MGTRVNPRFKDELFHFGARDIETCFNCGNCTAICSHAGETHNLPRITIRRLQLGLKKEILQSADPWLCFYCGDCSRTCPRQASPGENVMAVRRWLTAQYDWTGISRKLYASTAWEVGMLLAVSFLVVMFFVVGHLMFPGRIVSDHVSVESFAPVEAVHYGDWTLALLLLFFLGTNAMRMFRMVMDGYKGPSISFWMYLVEAKTFMIQLLTQSAWRKCEGTTRWWKHLLLVMGYAVMFLLVVAFLPWFQQDLTTWHWTSLFGYFGTVALLYVTYDALASRMRKTEEIHKFSHVTDWMYLVLLFLTALTGIFLHLFRLLNLPWPTYISYVVHLAIAVPMLVVEVPFGKWAHLIYRPLALYLNEVRNRAEARAAAMQSAAEPALTV